MEERLQKIVAHAGIASRRKAEVLIRQGRVTVNGRIVTRLGSKADPDQDHIKVDGRLIRSEAKIYYALNKPQGVISSARDPRGRPVVTELVPKEMRVYPAGRLDFDSEGLILLTNDGEVAEAVTRAGSVSKVYRVKLSGQPGEEELNHLRAGIRLSDGTQLARCEIRLLRADKSCWFEVVLKQGRNRQIRRMFDQIGFRVMRIRRVAIGPIRLRNLRPGEYRKLDEREIQELSKVLRGRKD